MTAANDKVVSVVIPVKNEAKKIRDCIEGILSQTVKVKEIVVVDSGSTDGTLDILKEYDKVKVVEIPGSEFNHGLTRNLGVSHTSGEYVLLTVGDARPYNDVWIEELLKGFDDDHVAGVCGKQVVPHELDKNPFEWYRPYSKPGIKKFDYSSEEFKALPPMEKRKVCSWDDVSAMYRADIIKQIPFQKTSYSEDSIWAKDAAMAGYSLVYNDAAIVYHYHHVDDDFTFKRTFTSMYFRYKHFGCVYPVPAKSLRQYLSDIKYIVTLSKVPFSKKMEWYSYNQRQFRAIKKAVSFFNESVKQGEEHLDEVHQKLCGKPPIPLKR